MAAHSRASSEALVLYLCAAIIIAGTWRTPGTLCAWLALCAAVAMLTNEALAHFDHSGRVTLAALGWLSLLAAPWLPLVKGLG